MLGERIKQLRKRKRLTQEELGNLINVTKVSISGYENGHRNPDTETLQRIADVFDVTTDYLLGREDWIALYDEDEDPAEGYILIPIDHNVNIPKGTKVLVSDIEFTLQHDFTMDELFVHLSNKYDMKEFTYGDVSRINVSATMLLINKIKTIANGSNNENTKDKQKEEKDIAKRMEQIRKDLTSEDGLMFNGEPMSEEAVESFLEAMEYAVRQTQRINKKYIPKKYRNNEEN